ncbi:MAG: hypothetical protein RBR52_13000 [Thiomonas sp.]|nr:hypothetical protein [Thiomonas sp.]MDY0331392.1 hypothetical protein [Thiomonas sp.]
MGTPDREQLFHRLRSEQIIVVQRFDERPSGKTYALGKVFRLTQRLGIASIGHSRIALCIDFGNSSDRVGRAVIEDENLDMRVGLRQCAVQAGGEEVSAVRRDHYGHERLVILGIRGTDVFHDQRRFKAGFQPGQMGVCARVQRDALGTLKACPVRQAGQLLFVDNPCMSPLAQR